MTTEEGGVEDLTALSKPTFDEIVRILESRYYQDQIYTYIGDILLSINPSKDLPIYGPQVGRRYTNDVQSGINRLPPHVFQVVNTVLLSLNFHHSSQCVLLTGESGAGKTEVVKMLASQLLRKMERQHPHSSLICEKVLQAINILDMFGCSVTPANTNSSRYGKLWQYFLNEQGDIVGAKVKVQGLDRSRVMFQDAGHTNFHVFYQLLAGLPPSDLKIYFLDRSYRILESEDTSQMFKSEESVLQYKDDFVYLQAAMTSLGLDFGLQSSSGATYSIVFGLLSAILSLGNIHFATDPETDEVFITNEREVDIAAVLMAVSVSDLMSIFLAKTIYERGEKIVKMNDFAEACTARNSFLRFLYTQLFSWLAQQINASLQAGDSSDQDLCLSIIDFPGYENFDTNSFEELCHNMADEKIRHHVTSMIFAEEYHDLDQNGVRGYRTKYHDNAELVEMFSCPKSTFVSILDEESTKPAPSPLGLVQKLHKFLAKSKVFTKTEANNNKAFVIVHTKGEVEYDASLLLTKNRDRVDVEAVEVMKQSRNPLVVQLFSTADNQRTSVSSQMDYSATPQWTSPNRSYNESISRQTGRKLRKSAKQGKMADVITNTGPSRMYNYITSFDEVLQTVKTSRTHCIWCIKPNKTSLPNFFDHPFVISQLKNIQEITCQRKYGFPDRIPLREFFERYKFLSFPATAEPRSVEAACNKILQRARLQNWRVGRSKVFLPLKCRDVLDAMLDLENKDVVVVQSVVRGFLVRQRLRHMRQSQEHHGQELADLADAIFKNGGRIFYALREQRDHDQRKFERRVHGYDQQRDRRYQQSPRYDGLDYSYDMRRQVSRTPSYEETDVEEFQKRVLTSVMQRKQELDPSTWCKVIYMEYGRELGKVYIQEKEFFVDGSYNKFDGQRLGLGVFQNKDRDENTEYIRAAIMQGVSLRKDVEGNIWVKRLTRYNVIAKGHTDPGNHCLSAEIILDQGRIPFEEPVKIFDAKEFKSQVGLCMKGSVDKKLHFLCLCGLSFVQDTVVDLETPCWICLVNIMALNALESSDVWREVEVMMAGVRLKSEEQEEEEDQKSIIKKRHVRNVWSRTDQRQNLNMKESPRKVREQLRRQGESISSHMGYSWTRQPSSSSGNKMTIEDLQDMATSDQRSRFGTQSSSGDLGRSRQREWAKLKVTVKEVKAKESEETEAAQKSFYKRY